MSMSSVAAISYRRARPLSVSLKSSERCFSSTAPNPKQDDPWWSLSSLHKRVATIIATSLPDSSRSDLHQSLSKSLNSADSHKSHSIAEAIVSANARDVSVQQSSRHNNAEKQKQIEKEIEQRALKTAQERMELELLAMKEQLKRKEEEQIRVEKEPLKKREVERQREEAFTKWQEKVAREQQQEKETVNQAQKAAEEEQNNYLHKDSDSSVQEQHHHPILGPQIAHLPYKRIHLTAASKLASLPVYEKQRAYRHDRAKEMAKDKKKTLWMGIPGVISLMEEECGRLSILDGQHRVGMMALLSEEQRKIVEKNQKVNGDNGTQSSTNNDKVDALAQLDLENILVEVFLPQQKNNNTDTVLVDSKKQKQPPPEEQDDKAIIFTEINKAEPIKLLDLPGVTNKRTRDVIDYAANHFYNAFPEMFSPSQKCRAPHLNLDNLRDALFASEVIKREKVGSGGELVKWMAKKNDELKEVYTSDAGLDGGKKVSENALKKAKKHEFYLGLESTWLYK
mmetsp:Transcript_23494/g.34860  ORF Transcript_23494/g.34860 Transcript_23494/m.34860 type:complete len:510 (-) Transcript_23494:591-2120(-)